jgi:hypothetical protein
MKKIYKQDLMATALTVALSAASLPLTAPAAPYDPGWPRVFKQDGKQLTVYQPQVDYWNGYTNLHYTCAIAVKGVSDQEQYGMVEVDASTVTDPASRVVAITPLTRNVTYVTVQDSSPTTVTYAQTSGYSGEYVAPSGVLMFGAGMPMGAADTTGTGDYYPPYPAYYSYGSEVAYNYAYGPDRLSLDLRRLRNRQRPEPVQIRHALARAANRGHVLFLSFRGDINGLRKVCVPRAADIGLG